MHALVAAVLLGFTGLDELRQDPEPTHQADNWDSRPRVLVAKGTPLSVRMRCGKPNSWNKRRKTGLASATEVERSA